MGISDYLDDDGPDWDDLPAVAIDNSDHPPDINDDWFKQAKDDEKLTAMELWFRARYWDPANDTPHNSREGGYLFIHGGPYDPDDVLQDRFSDIASYELICELKDKLYLEVGDEWAPIDRGYDDWDYDQDFDIEIEKQSEPINRLKERISHCEKILAMKGDAEAESFAKNLVFSAAISALEAFLWETMSFWVNHDEDVVINIVKNIPDIGDESIKIKDIFEHRKNIKNRVHSYLQNLVWHRWDKVFPLFKSGLGINIPSFKKIKEATIKRHDIVHRSDSNQDGEKIIIIDAEISELFKEILQFSINIDDQISAKLLISLPIPSS